MADDRTTRLPLQIRIDLILRRRRALRRAVERHLKENRREGA